MARSGRIAVLLMLAVVATSIAGGGCSSAPDESITVFAAASLTDALQAAAGEYTERTGVEIRISLGASSTLARQIDAGADVDVFLSASEDWMDRVAARLVPGSRRVVARNRLALICPPGRPFTWSPGQPLGERFEGWIALADPNHVPAGIYAREALIALGGWRGLEARVAAAADVRGALALVARGECDAGIVYASDAATGNVVTAAVLPESSHSPITYPGAAIATGQTEAAEAFLDFLARGAGRAIVAAVFAGEGHAGHDAGHDEVGVLLLSLRVALLCVLLSLPPGIFMGWLLARGRFRGKVVVEALCYLPLVVPPVVTGYVLLLLFGREGVFGAALEAIGLTLAFNWKGAALASAVVGFPLMVRAIRMGIEGVDPRLESAARTLGAGRRSVFFTVTLPLALPGVITGALLSFARSLGEFGATITFTSNIEGETRTLPLAVFSLIQEPGRDEAVLRLVLISVAISFAALVLSEVFARRRPR